MILRARPSPSRPEGKPQCVLAFLIVLICAGLFIPLTWAIYREQQLPSPRQPTDLSRPDSELVRAKPVHVVATPLAEDQVSHGPPHPAYNSGPPSHRLAQRASPNHQPAAHHNGHNTGPLDASSQSSVSAAESGQRFHPAVQPPSTLVAEDSGSRSRRQLFEGIYRGRVWVHSHFGPRGHSGPASGMGSTLTASQGAQAAIKDTILRSRGRIRSVLDLACGDLTWVPSSLFKFFRDHNVSYHGGDIVQTQIDSHRKRFSGEPGVSFSVIDAVAPQSAGRLPKVDLVICREALQHMPFTDAQRVLNHISESGSKQLLTTSYHNDAPDANTKADVKYAEGENTLLNLRAAPYGLPEALEEWADGPHWMYKRNIEFFSLWNLPLPKTPRQ